MSRRPGLLRALRPPPRRLRARLRLLGGTLLQVFSLRPLLIRATTCPRMPRRCRCGRRPSWMTMP
eukprot:4332127-Alexandrium_andersonii.AAC.1